MASTDPDVGTELPRRHRTPDLQQTEHTPGRPTGAADTYAVDENGACGGAAGTHDVERPKPAETTEARTLYDDHGVVAHVEQLDPRHTTVSTRPPALVSYVTYLA